MKHFSPCHPDCNCCCPEIRCLSDSQSAWLLLMSESPCRVGGNISLSLSFTHSLNRLLTPLSPLPHLLDFDQNTTSLNGMTVPHPDSLRPFWLSAPSPPFLVLLSPTFPTSQTDQLSGHKVSGWTQKYPLNWDETHSNKRRAYRICSAYKSEIIASKEIWLVLHLWHIV